MTVILRWIRRKGHNFEASLGYIVTFFLKKKKRTNKCKTQIYKKQ